MGTDPPVGPNGPRLTEEEKRVASWNSKVVDEVFRWAFFHLHRLPITEVLPEYEESFTQR